MTGSAESDPWAFNYRSGTFLETDSSDDETAHNSKHSRHSRDAALLKDLDIGSREESVTYKPNPFSIAKINAASRSSNQNVVKDAPVNCQPTLATNSSTSESRTIDTFFNCIRKRREENTDMPKSKVKPSSTRPFYSKHHNICAQAASGPNAQLHVSSPCLDNPAIQPRFCTPASVSHKVQIQTAPRIPPHESQPAVAVPVARAPNLVSASPRSSLRYLTGINQHTKMLSSKRWNPAAPLNHPVVPRSDPTLGILPQIEKALPFQDSPLSVYADQQVIALQPRRPLARKDAFKVTPPPSHPTLLNRTFAEAQQSLLRSRSNHSNRKIRHKEVEGDEDDENWSTLPQRKRFKPSVSSRSQYIKSSGTFRLPLALNPPVLKKTGMKATSRARVITFLPPPLRTAHDHGGSSDMKNESTKRSRLMSPRSSPISAYSQSHAWSSEIEETSPIRESSPPTSDPVNEHHDIALPWDSDDLDRRFWRMKRHVEEV